LEDGREAEIPLDILSFKAPKRLTKEEWKKLAEKYKGRPLPPEYYADFKPGRMAWSQMHIRGISPEDKEAYDKGKKSFEEIIVGHSLHQDFRIAFQGLSKFVEWVFLEDSMESYFRFNLGKRDPKTGNVQKSLCVGGNTYLLTPNGFRKAAYIKVGDLVLAGDGRFHRVEAVSKRKPNANDQILKVKSPLGFPFIVTSDHPCLDSNSEWRPIREVEYPYQLKRVVLEENMYYPRKLYTYNRHYSLDDSDNEVLHFDEEFFRWLGFWVAEGSVGDVYHRSYQITLVQKNKAILEKYNLLNRFKLRKREDKDSWILSTSWKGLAEFLHDHFTVNHPIPSESSCRYNKTAPLWLANLPKNLFDAFWAGLHEGDGKSTNPRMVFTSSPDLAGRLYLILMARGELPAISYRRTSHKDSFTIIRQTVHPSHNFLKKEKATNYRGYLYDFQIKDEHSFFVPNIVLHNCIVKPSAEEPSGEIEKASRDKMLITEKDAELIEKYALHEYDVWLAPGDVGATWRGWGVLVTITIGVAQPGIQRPDLHEYFYYPSPNLPKINQKLLNGRIIVKAFKKPRPLWWAWLAVRDSRPMNPWCFDTETEIYTKSGWKSIYTIKSSDLVASLNPHTLEWEWSKINQIIKFNYSGEAYLLESRDISLLAHPKHMQPLFVDYKNEITFITAENYEPKYCWWFLRGANWNKHDGETMWISNHAYPKTNLCELVGWIVGDGFLTKPQGENHYYIGISQEKKHNLEIIYQLAKNTTRKVKKFKNSVVIRDHILADYLAEEIGLRSSEKRVPSFIKESSSENIQAFLRGLLGSDGYYRNRAKCSDWGERVFYTSSTNLADDLAELIIKSGGSVSYYIDCRKGRICFDKYKENYDSIHIRWKRNTATLSKRVEKKKVFYNGVMWDVELERNHILLVRRHGRVFWTGNCHVDQGEYYPIKAEKLRYFSKEDYPEWKERKKDCE